MEEIGRAVAPVPFFTSAVLATSALLKAGETEVLGQLAAGDSTAALIVPLSTAPGTFTPTVKATASGLVGSVTTVAGVAESDVLVVPVAGESGLELHTVRIADATVTPVSVPGHDAPIGGRRVLWVVVGPCRQRQRGASG